MTRIGRRSFLCVLLLAPALAGPRIATAQAPKGSADLRKLAGKWSGTAQAPQGTYPIEWTIKDDGTVAVVVVTPDGPRNGTGKMSVKDGTFFYETRASSGIVTLEEDGGRRVLKYDAVFTRDNSRGSAELTAVR